MHHDVSVTAAGAVTLVTVRLTNDAPVDRRVRVENRLAGPVLPPRRAGVPEAGWSETGFEGVVAAGSTRALGYACPTGDAGRPSDAERDLDSTPVDVSVLGRDAACGGDEGGWTPDDVVRELGSSRPPADAVPLPADGGDLDDDGASEARVDEGGGVSEAPVGEDGGGPAAADTRPAASPPADPPERAAPSPAEPTDAAVAAAVADGSSSGSDREPSLDAVERRVALAERLAGVSVAEAADVLSSSPVPPKSLSSLDADRRRLRRLAARAAALADRAAAVDPDLDAFRRRA